MTTPASKLSYELNQGEAPAQPNRRLTAFPDPCRETPDSLTIDSREEAESLLDGYSYSH